jgi:pimeloyl-ACP methyl ester carboxylesterase
MQTSQTTQPPILSQSWQWRDRSIHYVRAENSDSTHPPLLLVHGFGASTDHWRKNIEGLRGEFDVWAIDLLGFGRSAKPDIQYSGELWRDQLHEFIRDVIGRPTVLAGNSLGGYASLCVAAQHPESVAGLVLLNSAGPFGDRESQPKPSPNLLRRTMTGAFKSAFKQNWVIYLIFQYTRRKSVIRKTLEKVYLDRAAVTDRLVEEIYRPSGDPGAAKVFASVFRTPRGETVDRLLHQLQRPLLMLWGEGDPWMNVRERSAKFRQHYPQLQEYYLPAGHCPHDEIPDRVNQLIRDWVVSAIH